MTEFVRSTASRIRSGSDQKYCESYDIVYPMFELVCPAELLHVQSRGILVAAARLRHIVVFRSLGEAAHRLFQYARREASTGVSA